MNQNRSIVIRCGLPKNMGKSCRQVLAEVVVDQRQAWIAFPDAASGHAEKAFTKWEKSKFFGSSKGAPYDPDLEWKEPSFKDALTAEVEALRKHFDGRVPLVDKRKILLPRPCEHEIAKTDNYWDIEANFALVETASVLSSVRAGKDLYVGETPSPRHFLLDDLLNRPKPTPLKSNCADQWDFR